MSTTKKSVTDLHEFWEKGYESENTPFDIAEPDEWIAELEKQGKIRGKIFDAGCGPGRTAIYLAGLGYDVVGADISNNAIERAKRKAAEMKVSAQFFQADLCRLSGYDNAFDTVIDIGCFHSLFKEDLQLNYAQSLHRSCRKGAMLYLRAFSDANGNGTHHSGFALPAVSGEQIQTAFQSNGWHIRELEHRLIDLLADGRQRKQAWCRFAQMECQ